MSFTINIDQNRFTLRSDSRTASNYQLPSLSTRDLSGCGNPDFFRFSLAYLINYRSGCAKSVPAISLSVKSLVKATGTSPINLSAHVEELIESISGYIENPAPTTPLVDTAVISTTPSGGAAWSSNIKEYISDGTTTGNGRIVVSTPTVTLLRDVCQPTVVTGINMSTSYTLQSFDPATCKTSLQETVSISASFWKKAVYNSATPPSDIPWGTISSTLIKNAFYSNSQINNYFDSALFNPTASLSDNQDDVVAVFNAHPPLNTLVTFGI